MRRSIPQGVAGVVVGAALLMPTLSGCGGDAEAESSSPAIAQSDIDRIASAAASASSMPSAAKTSTGSGATTPARPSASASAATDFVLPEAAKAHTKDGAKAFVQFYFDMLDRLSKRPQNGIIERFSAPSCTSCQMQSDAVRTMLREHATVEVSGSRVSDVGIRKDSTTDSVVVTFTQTDRGSKRVVAGKAPERIKPTNLYVAARADWTGSGWKLGASGADEK